MNYRSLHIYYNILFVNMVAKILYLIKNVWLLLIVAT